MVLNFKFIINKILSVGNHMLKKVESKGEEKKIILVIVNGRWYENFKMVNLTKSKII